MKPYALIALTALSPTIAFADAQLDRFEQMANGMNKIMVDMMAFEVESQGGDASALRDASLKLPDWNDEMRAAAGCVLEGYRSEVGEAPVDTMLDNMEELIETLDESTMSEFNDDLAADSMLPEGISFEKSMDLSTSCGMMDLQMKVMQESGIMEAMMIAGATIPDNN